MDATNGHLSSPQDYPAQYRPTRKTVWPRGTHGRRLARIRTISLSDPPSTRALIEVVAWSGVADLCVLRGGITTEFARAPPRKKRTAPADTRRFVTPFAANMTWPRMRSSVCTSLQTVKPWSRSMTRTVVLRERRESRLLSPPAQRSAPRRGMPAGPARPHHDVDPEARGASWHRRREIAVRRALHTLAAAHSTSRKLLLARALQPATVNPRRRRPVRLCGALAFSVARALEVADAAAVGPTASSPCRYWGHCQKHS